MEIEEHVVVPPMIHKERSNFPEQNGSNVAEAFLASISGDNDKRRCVRF